jgi:cytochrome c oxidase cbb3-type subunit 2
MKKAFIFVFGGTSTITLSIFLFILVPRMQVTAVNRMELSAQAPYTEKELAGRKVYIQNGCVYCHSQQVRDPSVGADQHFGWGRASLPSDYIHDKPHLLGTMRTGPDLSNIGSRQPSRDWHHLHFFNPRLLVNWSIMPDFSFLYQVSHSVEKPSESAIKVPKAESTWIIPSSDAEALVSYMQSLRRDREPFKQENAQ